MKLHMVYITTGRMPVSPSWSWEHQSIHIFPQLWCLLTDPVCMLCTVPGFLLFCLLLSICAWMSHISSLTSVSWAELARAQDVSQLRHSCICVWARQPQAHPPQSCLDPSDLSWEMLP